MIDYLKKKKVTLYFIWSFTFSIVYLYSEYYNQRVQKNTINVSNLTEDLIYINSEFDKPSVLLINNQSLNYNVIFVNTESNLSIVQLCSIESAAINNPQANVQLFSLTPQTDDLNFLLKSYKNINQFHINLTGILSGTRLLAWWQNRKDPDRSNTKHVSNIARLALIYKLGGVYSDLGSINIRKYAGLLNFDGFSGYKHPDGRFTPGNSILVFKKNHPFIKKCINGVMKLYEPDKEETTGSLLIKRVASQACHGELFYKRSKLENVCNITVFPQSFFYQYRPDESEYIFTKTYMIDTRRFLNSFSIMFDHQSKLKTSFSSDASVYDYFAVQNCPLTFERFQKDE